MEIFLRPSWHICEINRVVQLWVFVSNYGTLWVEFGAGVFQEWQELFFALLSCLLLYRKVLLDRIDHVFNQFKYLLFASLSRLALRTDRLSDGFCLFNHSLDQQSVLLLPLMRLSLVAILQLWEVSFQLILKNSHILTALLRLLHDFILEHGAPLIDKSDHLSFSFTTRLQKSKICQKRPWIFIEKILFRLTWASFSKRSLTMSSSYLISSFRILRSWSLKSLSSSMNS